MKKVKIKDMNSKTNSPKNAEKQRFLNVFQYIIDTSPKHYGYGTRLVIWTQGCSLHCKGCVNSQLWNFGIGQDLTFDEFLQLISPKNIEGVTMLGGEPLDQADVLLPYMEMTKKIGKTILLFTGYRKRELKGNAKKIWELADITVSGRYEAKHHSDFLAFRGSTNQRVTYKNAYKNAPHIPDDHISTQLVDIDENGEILLHGFLTPEIDSFIKNIKQS